MDIVERKGDIPDVPFQKLVPKAKDGAKPSKEKKTK